MDNAGDWLYIVFLIVAGISGLLSSKKKKKHPTEVLGQPGREIVVEHKEAPQKGFWELLEEMQQEKTQPVQPVVTSKKKQKTPKAASPASFENIKNASKATFIARQSIMADNPVDDSLLDDMDFDNAAELRKAVIYSEILNRKY